MPLNSSIFTLIILIFSLNEIKIGPSCAFKSIKFTEDTSCLDHNERYPRRTFGLDGEPSTTVTILGTNNFVVIWNIRYWLLFAYQIMVFIGANLIDLNTPVQKVDFIFFCRSDTSIHQHSYYKTTKVYFFILIVNKNELDDQHMTSVGHGF